MEILDLIRAHRWAAEVLALFVILGLLTLGLRRAVSKERKFRFDLAILAPARAFIWLILLAFIIELLFRDSAGLFAYVPPLRNAGIVFCCAWFLLRWKKEIVRSLKHQEEETINLTSLEMLNKVGTIFVISLSALIILSLFKIDIVPLVTFGGIGAAALGFASKDMMGNFFGGLMIHISQPFALQDQIELPQKNINGHIEKIGWYFSAIRDLDKRLVYVPNSCFTTDYLINISRMTHRLLHDTFAIRYADLSKIQPLTEQITRVLREHPDVDATLPISVYLHDFSDKGLEIEVKAYLQVTRYDQYKSLKHKLLIQIADQIEQSGITLAPSATLEILK
jgi:MscS family membrane protein